MTKTPKVIDYSGKCQACKTRPASGGRKTCQQCADRNLKYTKAKIEARRASGVCSSCGTRPINSVSSTHYCTECLIARKESKKARYYLCKQQVFEQYGGYECSCCGETTKEFLTIDHIAGGGNRHRKSIRIDFYVWLVRNKFPEGFQVLCMNCQFGKRFCGECPHSKSIKSCDMFLPDHMG